MVRERVQHFYGFGGGRSIEIHDATPVGLLGNSPIGSAYFIMHNVEPQNSTLVEACGSARDYYGSKTYRLDICNLDPHLTLLTPVFCPYVWPPENDLRLVVSPEEEQSIYPIDGVQQWQTFIVLDPDGKRHMTFSPTTVNIDTTMPRSKDFCARTLYINEDTTSFS
jgi:hypothetical protein